MAASRATTAAAAATAYPAAGPAEASSSIHQAEYTDPAASTSAAPMDWEAAEQAGGRASAPPSESRPPSWFHLAVRGYAARHVSSSPAPAPSPAAPSSTLPGEDLATEILPAPPRLPYDARYPALAPHAEGSNRKRLVGVPGPGSEGPVPYGLPAFAATAAATGPRFSRGRNGAKSVKVNPGKERPRRIARVQNQHGKDTSASPSPFTDQAGGTESEAAETDPHVAMLLPSASASTSAAASPSTDPSPLPAMAITSDSFGASSLNGESSNLIGGAKADEEEPFLEGGDVASGSALLPLPADDVFSDSLEPPSLTASGNGDARKLRSPVASSSAISDSRSSSPAPSSNLRPRGSAAKRPRLTQELDRGRRSSSVASARSSMPPAALATQAAGQAAAASRCVEVAAMRVNGIASGAATLPLPNGFPAPPAVPVLAATGRARGDEDRGLMNNEYCETCKGIGRFLCCDGCPRSFHFACINPPLDIDELPSDDDAWYCQVCRSTKDPPHKPPKGTFQPLLHKLEFENPTIFALPPDIRNYFKGVGTAADGSYVNAELARPLRMNKQGFVEERDPFKLKDRNGKPVTCYRCGGTTLPADSLSEATDGRETRGSKRVAAKDASAENVSAVATPSAGNENEQGWRKILSCDFCSLHWHLDCLEPPLIGMPSMTRKWMCPNHSDHLQAKRRVPKSHAAVQSVNLPIPSRRTIGPGRPYAFMRVRNNGQIDVIPDSNDQYFDRSDGSGRSFDKGWEEVGLGAESKVRYRLPEKVIRLDFWNRVRPGRRGMDIFKLAAQEARRNGARFVSVRDPEVWRDVPFVYQAHAAAPRTALDSLVDAAIAQLRTEGLRSEEPEEAPMAWDKGKGKARDLVKTALDSGPSTDGPAEGAKHDTVDGVRPATQSAQQSRSATSSQEKDTSGKFRIRLPAAHTSPKGKTRKITQVLDTPSAAAADGDGREGSPSPNANANASLRVDDGEDMRPSLSNASSALTDLGAPSGDVHEPSSLAKQAPPSLERIALRAELRGARSEDVNGVDGQYGTGAGHSRALNAAQAAHLASSTSAVGAETGAASAGVSHGLTEADIEQLLAVRELMKAKGEKAMLEFLTSK